MSALFHRLVGPCCGPVLGDGARDRGAACELISANPATGAGAALVLLAVFGSLRWGELAALRRRDIDLEFGAVRVERSLSELPGGGYLFGPPKSAAGQRVVVVPAAIKPALTHHLATFTAPGPDALVFTSPTGAPMRPSNFRRRVWVPTLAKAGLPGIHFHDLRHTGNTLTAATGATLREMMDRMGPQQYPRCAGLPARQ